MQQRRYVLVGERRKTVDRLVLSMWRKNIRQKLEKIDKTGKELKLASGGGGWSRSSNPSPPSKRVEILATAVRVFFAWVEISFWPLHYKTTSSLLLKSLFDFLRSLRYKEAQVQVKKDQASSHDVHVLLLSVNSNTENPTRSRPTRRRRRHQRFLNCTSFHPSRNSISPQQLANTKL